MNTLSAEATTDALSQPLLAILRHNLWANQLLYETCLQLEEAHLTASDPGAYGTIYATLEHLVRAEQGYLRHLTGQFVGERWPHDKRPTLAEMLALIQLTGQGLIDFAAQAKPGDVAVVHWDNQGWSIPVGTLLTQVVNHATEHRTNVTTILNRQGLQPPKLDGWTYYMAIEAQVVG